MVCKVGVRAFNWLLTDKHDLSCVCCGTQVSANPLVYVYDSPGIISPTITDMHTGMKLALCGTHLVNV